jgi:hypothetical protein
MASTKKTRRVVGLWRTHCGSQEVRLYQTGDDNTAPTFCWEAGTVYPFDQRAIAGTTSLDASSVEEAISKCRTHLLENSVIPNQKVVARPRQGSQAVTSMGGPKVYVSPRVVQLLPRLKDEDRCALLQPVVGRARLFRPDVPVRVVRVETVPAEAGQPAVDAPVAAESQTPQAELFV